MSAITKRLNFFLCSLFALFFLPLIAGAAGLNPAAGDINVLPGAESSFTFTLENTSAETKTYTVDVIALDLTGGEMTFTELDEEVALYVRVDRPQIILDPNSESIISVRATPSADVRPEVHTLGVRVVEQIERDADIVVREGFIAPLFLTVDGDIDARYRIKDARLSRSFATRLPLSVSLTLQNDGDRIIQPTGNVTIRDMFGRTVDVVPVNVEQKRIIAGEERTYAAQWMSASPAMLGGIYTFDVDVQLWPNGDRFTQQFKGVVVSVPAFAAIIAVALLFLFIAWAKRIPRSV